jgi:uncharacterized protein DUF4159
LLTVKNPQFVPICGVGGPAALASPLRALAAAGQASHSSAVSHPIFNTFFQIDSLKVPYPGRLGERGLMGEFFGIHENNDPSRRLTVMINYNIDIGDYVEWSGENLYNREATNEAYKFMINYVIYGLTH